PPVDVCMPSRGVSALVCFQQTGALTMKRLCVAGAVLTSVLAGSAMAADLPLKAPGYAAPLSWTGFYIGVHGGYGWAPPSINDLDLNQPFAIDDLSLDAPKLRGAVFGGHAGYNWQWGQRGVVGLEIDYSAADITSTQGASVTDVGSISTRALLSKLDGLASVRARVGFLIGPEFLLYGTGGAAWGHTRFTDTLVRVFQNDSSELVFVNRASANHFGWVAGAGGEWKLWNSGLMLRVEYLHYDFGSASLAFDTTVDNSKQSSFNVPLDRLTTNVVRAGVSYKFWESAGGPQ